MEGLFADIASFCVAMIELHVVTIATMYFTQTWTQFNICELLANHSLGHD